MSARLISRGKLLRKLIRSAKSDVVLGLTYFLENVSVGEAVALKELGKYVSDPREVIAKLIEGGFVERSQGCYNLSRRLRGELRDLAEIEGKDVLTVSRELAARIRWWLQ